MDLTLNPASSPLPPPPFPQRSLKGRRPFGFSGGGLQLSGSPTSGHCLHLVGGGVVRSLRRQLCEACGPCGLQPVQSHCRLKCHTCLSPAPPLSPRGPGRRREVKGQSRGRSQRGRSKAMAALAIFSCVRGVTGPIDFFYCFPASRSGEKNTNAASSQPAARAASRLQPCSGSACERQAQAPPPGPPSS